MADERAKRDVNYRTVGTAVTNDANLHITMLRVDPTTKRLLVDVNGPSTGVTDGELIDAADLGTLVLGSDGANYQILKTDSDGNLQVDIVSGGAGGVQYTEGDTDATIVGTAMMMEVAANALQPVQGTVADGLLVNLGANNDVAVTGTVDLGATDNAVLDAIAASVAAIDTDATTIIGYVDGIEALLAGTIAVSNAGLTEIAGAINASAQMDVNIAANGIGLATSAKQDTIIGHVDGIETFLGTIDSDTSGILTAVQLIDNAVSGAGFNITQFNGAAVPIGAGLEATALRVTVATDSTGVLSVDDNGASLTVDNAGLTALNGAIAGTEVQVDIVGALPAGTNAIGKLAANSGVDIGDVDVTSIVPGTAATSLGKAEDGAHTSGDVGVFALGVRNDTPNTALAGTDLDYSAISTYKTGSVRTAFPEDDFAVLGSNHVKKYYTNAGAVTDGIVWSPAAGKRWYVTDIIINTSAAATVTLEDDLAAGDSAVLKAELAANSGIAHHFATPLFSGEDAADLIVTTSAGNIYITITGYEI